MTRPASLRVAAAVLASQLAIGWVNDWLDADRDRAVGRTDKPVATGAIDRRTVGICGAVAAVACVVLSLFLGWPAGALMISALVSALLYDWPLKLTALSVLPYAVSFGLLPGDRGHVAAGLAGARRPGWWRPAPCSGAGAHFANALPDLDDDARTGVRGLPQRLGRTGSALAAAGLLLAATVALVFGPPGAPVVGRHRRDRRGRRGAADRVVRRPARDRPGRPAGRGLPRGDGGGAHRRRPAGDER